MRNLFLTLILLLPLAIFNSCNEDLLEPSNEDFKTSKTLEEKFGIIKTEENVLIDLRKINNLNLTLHNFIEKNNIIANKVVRYADGNTALLFNLSSSNNVLIIKINKENNFLGEQMIKVSNIRNSDTEANFDIEILNSNGTIQKYSVVNNSIFRESMFKSDFNDCFVENYETLTDDWLGIVVTLTNPIISAAACAIPCI